MTLLHADKNAHNGGYLIGTALFFAILAGLVVWQIAARRFYPVLYWATIVASTTFGTTMADLADRSLGIGYTGGSRLLFALPDGRAWPVVLVGTDDLGQHGEHAAASRHSIGRRLPFRRRSARRSATGWRILAGSATKAGRWFSRAGLAVLAALYFWSNVSRVLLFWAAFILTRPLGATVGDFLDKPLSHGGLALSRPLASAVIGAFILVCLLVLPQRAGAHPARSQAL